MRSSGTSALVRWMCSATGRILSSAKRWNVSAASWKSSGRWLGPVPVRSSVAATDSRNSGERCSSTKGHASPSTDGVDAPDALASEQLGAEVGDRVGDERAREERLDLTAVAVVEHHLGALDRAGGVGEVVAEHLVLVEAGDGDATVDGRGTGQVLGGDGDDLRRSVDGRGGRGGATVVGVSVMARSLPTPSRDQGLDVGVRRRRRRGSWSPGGR